MAETNFDIIVVGGGPGGYVAAIRAAQLGLKTAVVEREHMGGICLNWGCIPTKALLRTSEVYSLIMHADAYGLSVKDVSFDAKKIVERSRKVANQLSSGVSMLMKKNKITVFDGAAKLAGAGKLTVVLKDKSNATLSYKNVILATGGAMIFFGKFDVEALVREMPRATALMGVPTFYTRLLDHPAFTRDLTKGVRLFVSGSAPLLAETHGRFEERTGHRILERYGMTETNMNTSNPYDGDRRAGTVGLPLPGVELKITDPATGATLPQGEVGVIEVRGANVFQGYWQMPEKTREELREDGFFITGDLARMDADGYVTIIGRGKDLIISGGFNVYPKEVETLLDEQPGVLESAVIGVPHPDLGEVAVGILVRQKGQEPDLDQIAAAMGQALARFKQPRTLIVVDELPRNTMGKVQKNILRQSYGGLFS